MLGQAESGGAERFSPSNRVARKTEREEACLILSAPSSVRASSFYQKGCYEHSGRRQERGGQQITRHKPSTGR